MSELGAVRLTLVTVMLARIQQVFKTGVPLISKRGKQHSTRFATLPTLDPGEVHFSRSFQQPELPIRARSNGRRTRRCAPEDSQARA